jgi:hypothetical protein
LPRARIIPHEPSGCQPLILKKFAQNQGSQNREFVAVCTIYFFYFWIYNLLVRLKGNRKPKAKRKKIKKGLTNQKPYDIIKKEMRKANLNTLQKKLKKLLDKVNSKCYNIITKQRVATI